MTHGILPRTGILALLPALAALFAGCSSVDSLQREAYPSHLKYPPRADLIVKTQSQKEDVKRLPPPGDLDDAIAKDNVPDAKAETYNPANLDKGDADTIRKTINQLFGTPAAPRVAIADAESGSAAAHWRDYWVQTRGLTEAGAIDDLLVDKERLERGSKLYRRHCLHCHGLAGDGRGPTGPWVSPHPRDYRQGRFKFISTFVPGGRDAVFVRKPRRDDLLRILNQGIDGTSMPSFGLLPESEKEYLISYVIHLSIRGQAEYGAMLARLEKQKRDEEQKKDGKPPTDEAADVKKAQGIFGDQVSATEHQVYSSAALALVDWAVSNSKPPVTPAATATDLKSDSPEMQESIKRGFALFTGQGGCLKCHIDFGRQSDYRFDVWGTNVRPANLTAGVYRGGRRPMDIMNRLKGGIEPSGMPISAVEKTKPNPNNPKEPLPDPEATDRANWDLVNFVRASPYPGMLPTDIREKVYGGGDRKKKD